MNPEIRIYYAEICGLCHKAMEWMQSRNLPFTKIEVFWDNKNDRWVDDENSRAMLRECGDVDFVPQIFISGQHIKGWRKLEPMIKSGEIEALLNASAEE